MKKVDESKYKQAWINILTSQAKDQESVYVDYIKMILSKLEDVDTKEDVDNVLFRELFYSEEREMFDIECQKVLDNL